jgi:hypothetical protein
VFGPPAAFVVSLAAIFKEKGGTWAVAGLGVSLITFALWLTAVVCGGFG